MDKYILLCKDIIKRLLMLSILIPTYEYNTLPLVSELHLQAINEGIEFEIIVLDDCSQNKEIIQENLKINELNHSLYEANIENIGRSKNRNLLIEKAKYKWILLLDCDTFPKNPLFIAHYLNAIQSSNQKVYFGGLAYKEEKPKKDEMLRWIYGKKRESIPLSIRKKNPYRYSLISNILLDKNILATYPFNTEIQGYGFEDMVFILELKKNNIQIIQIENPVYHLNLEKSIHFLEKYHSSLKNLDFLLKRKIIHINDTPLSKLYRKLAHIYLDKVVATVFKILSPILVRNLTSRKPSLFVFDLYKLGYFCLIKNQ